MKYLRERNGELQKDMCELLGVTEATMSKYESGYIEPDIEKLITLAEHFGVTIDDLILKELKPPIPLYVSNLKYMRMRYGMMQTDVGKLIGVGQRETSYYEKGEHEIPVTKLIILADFFGLTLDELVKQDLSKEK